MLLLNRNSSHVNAVQRHQQETFAMVLLCRPFQMQRNEFKYNFYHQEGGVRVCGIAVLGYFWCGVAVIFISKYGIAVFRVQAVCGKFKFHIAVVGEKIVVSR